MKPARAWSLKNARGAEKPDGRFRTTRRTPAPTTAVAGRRTGGAGGRAARWRDVGPRRRTGGSGGFLQPRAPADFSGDGGGIGTQSAAGHRDRRRCAARARRAGKHWRHRLPRQSRRCLRHGAERRRLRRHRARGIGVACAPEKQRRHRAERLFPGRTQRGATAGQRRTARL